MSEFTIDIEKQLNKLGKDIQDFVERIVPLEGKRLDYRPKCDIIESDDTYVIKVDLPGLTKKEIHVAFKGYVLTVKGERVIDTDDGESFSKQERPSGMFVRSFALPQNVVISEADALFRNGVLKISLPKTEILENAESIEIK